MELIITNENFREVGPQITNAMQEAFGDGHFEWNHSQNHSNKYGVTQMHRFVLPSSFGVSFSVAIENILYHGGHYKGYLRYRGLRLHNFALKFGYRCALTKHNIEEYALSIERVLTFLKLIAEINCPFEPITPEEVGWDDIPSGRNFIAL